MQSHRPIIINNLLQVLNSRFDSALSVGWDVATLSVNGLNVIQTDDGFQIHPRDTNFSLRQNVTAETVGNKAIAAQRFSVQDVCDVVKFHNGYMAVAAMCRFVDTLADANAKLELRFYDNTGTATIGSGSLLPPDDEEAVTYYLENDWGLCVHKARVPAGSVWVEIRLIYEIADVANFDMGSYAYWTNVFVGAMADFHAKGFNKISLKPNLGFKTNLGDGISEIVRVAKPTGELDIDIIKVLAGSDIDRDIQIMLDLMAIDAPQGCAIWCSRLLHTSRGRHYMDAILQSKSPKYTYAAGVTMRHYKFKFLLPSEF